MRRMLDPKELEELGGGGGSITLYRHHIYLSYKDNYNNYGFIYFDYYSTNANQFTADTLIAAMEGKSVICSGYLVITVNRIVVTITSTDNHLQVKSYNIAENRPGLGDFNISNDYITIQDQVYPIN